MKAVLIEKEVPYDIVITMSGEEAERYREWVANGCDARSKDRISGDIFDAIGSAKGQREANNAYRKILRST